MLQFNQKGFSVALALVMAALIAANTVYFIGLTKNSSITNSTTANQMGELNEQRRLSTLLSDSFVCKSVLGSINLGSVPTAPVIGAFSFTNPKSGIKFLENTASTPSTFDYVNNTHGPRSYWISYNGTPNQYTLNIRYDIANNRKANTIKGSTVAKIPLFIELDSSNNIQNCYANPSPIYSIVEKTVEAACVGNSAFKDPSNFSCKHVVIPFTSGPLNFIKTISLTAANEQQFSSDSFFGTGMNCGSAPMRKLMKSFDSNGNLSCATPDEIPCPGGTMLIMNGSTPVCSDNQTYATSNALFNSITAGGTETYYVKPDNVCPGKYVSGYSATGVASCADFTIVSEDCGPLKFATDLDTEATSAPLSCGSYTKTKSCTTPGPFSNIVSLATVVPTCNVDTN